MQQQQRVHNVVQGIHMCSSIQFVIPLAPFGLRCGEGPNLPVFGFSSYNNHYFFFFYVTGVRALSQPLCCMATSTRVLNAPLSLGFYRGIFRAA